MSAVFTARYATDTAACCGQPIEVGDVVTAYQGEVIHAACTDEEPYDSDAAATAFVAERFTSGHT